MYTLHDSLLIQRKSNIIYQMLTTQKTQYICETCIETLILLTSNCVFIFQLEVVVQGLMCDFQFHTEFKPISKYNYILMTILIHKLFKSLTLNTFNRQKCFILNCKQILTLIKNTTLVYFKVVQLTECIQEWRKKSFTDGEIQKFVCPSTKSEKNYLLTQ